ncbi:hypothetical protein CS022_24755 [Veronia nyctiphanis]|uniref:Uncharacterized protein n=1 Tax=Veronia nyctiphanis TaxID=1278244 RepID=A0A4Q0Y9V4_9GAMM|nr:hypothetical protein [Veronia nyctiphanis]RXJ65531.1 hypothetical protein CS022_24755 [Veronia nyctiphanis]
MRNWNSLKLVLPALLIGALAATYFLGFDAWQVSQQTELALTNCGKGNVASVSTTGYECKK